ncbi:MAG: multicopper oxidase domain-containing protein [Chitinophagaceae bacterium]
MKYLSLVVLLLGNFLFTAAQAVSYTCPMHPEIHSPKPGNCPKCGMKLVREKAKPAPAQKKPPVIPKKIPADTTSSQPTSSLIYTCPMHPEVQSSKPGNCPKCGMRLVKKEVSKTPANDPQPADTSSRQESHDMQQDSAHVSDQPVPKEPGITVMENKEPPKTVRYDLYITDTIVKFTNKSKHAIAVNGSIPMPVLTFTEGDTAEIYVHNRLKEETSLHWHGLMLPNQYDGVPNLTQMPIQPGTTHIYRFPIIQHGTHWYHSHTGLQEQIGMYGAFIMNKRKEWDIPTIPVVISEWTDMKPGEVNRSLHNGSDWFAIKKGSTQSYSEAIRSGHFKTKIRNEWKRMSAMDVSDVYYDRFLINGKTSLEQTQFRGGDRVRLRIANAGASSYFWLTYSGGKITVVASDGNDVEPVEVDRLMISVSETYDVIVGLPETKQYEFLVTPEDRASSASIWLGSGERVPAPRLPGLKYFAGMKMMNEMMAMNGNLMPMGMEMSNQTMDMNQVMYPEITGDEISSKDTMNDHQGHAMNESSVDLTTLNYSMLRATEKTTLPEGPLKELHFNLTGNMSRYVWTLDNKTVSESDRILIRKGENVRIVLYNNSMMRHPMHLHGHDFRILNGQGDKAPLKNVLDIMPMERDTIEFAANTSGDWFFHCHILYHMMSGMGRIFRYENSPVNPGITNPRYAQQKLFADDRMMHFMTRIGIESNGSDGEAMLAQTRWKVSTLWHLGYHDEHGYESETMIGRYLGKMQWWYPYIGFDYHFKMEGGPKNLFGNEDKNWFGQASNKLRRKTIIAGIAYTLPTLTIADLRIDGNGKFRFQLSREDIPATARLRFAWMINTDKEYMAGLRYITTKYLSLSTHYDSDMGWGAGFTITY